MPHRHPGNATLPEDLPLLKVLAELAGVLLLLLGLKAMDFVRWVIWPQTPGASAPSAAPTTRAKAQPMPPLQWRSPWWAWQLLAWAVATLIAPTLLITSSLLLVNSHSDHPLFWWSLPAIVAIGNAAAILCINQQHHRKPFTDRQVLARCHVVIAATTTATLFLLVGMVSGFLPDMAPAMSSHAGSTTFSALPAALCSMGLTVLFAILSFPFAGAIHASLAFQLADE